MVELATIIHLVSSINQQGAQVKQAWKPLSSAAMPVMDSAKKHSLIMFNIAGHTFSISQHLLQRFPSSRLASDEKLSPYWDDDMKAYYFDRDPCIFNEILNLHRYNTPQYSTENNLERFKEELQFWEIDRAEINIEWTEEEQHLENEFLQMENRMPAPSKCASRWTQIRYNIWCFLAEPRMLPSPWKFLAQVYVSVLVFCSIIYLVMFALSTDKSLRIPIAIESNISDSKVVCDTKIACLTTTLPLMRISSVTGVVFLVMLLDTFLRILFCPSKKLYFKSAINWMDCVASTGGFLAGYFTYNYQVNEGMSNQDRLIAIVICEALGNLRLLRIFQYAALYDCVLVMMLTIRASLYELAVLMFYLFMASLFFGSLIFPCDIQASSGKGIPSAIIGCWWAVITMTTVGYGDFYPQSAGGYIVGFFCVVAGLLLTALPIAVVGNKYNIYWEHRNKRQARNLVLSGKENILGN